LVEEFDLMVRRVGEWLAGKGFLGAFGIDALIFEERLYLTEVNPRFLGSSRLAADLDKFFDYPDVLWFIWEHIWDCLLRKAGVYQRYIRISQACHKRYIITWIKSQ